MKCKKHPLTEPMAKYLGEVEAAGTVYIRQSFYCPRCLSELGERLTPKDEPANAGQMERGDADEQV